ncbi:magnesium transporter CorA family protein [candidate division WOR-3 bacterium]|nr:magnesium transporter CorA family protein [candidate division WOR-3 bacterium]
MNAVSAELEGKINTAMGNKYLINMFGLEKSLTYYVAAINSNQMLIEKLKANHAKLGLTTEEAEFLDDIIIENNQCQRQAEIYSNILASMMDARASIVSNNLNVLMKTLNIITIGIMVPTLVVSIFSMNVRLPIPGEHRLAFWCIIALAAVSLVGVFYLWRRFWR